MQALSSVITVLYLVIAYLGLSRISFDVVWNSSSYPDMDGGLLFLYFLFIPLPCILSFILNTRKISALRQDTILYAFGSIFIFLFTEISSFLRLVGFITVYATIFDIYQLSKSKPIKSEEKPKEKKSSEQKDNPFIKDI